MSVLWIIANIHVDFSSFHDKVLDTAEMKIMITQGPQNLDISSLPTGMHSLGSAQFLSQ